MDKRRGVLALLILAAFAFIALKRDVASDPATFVGKWESTRSKTPTYIFANGEWEIRRDESKVLQFGVWRLESGSLIWTFKDHSGYRDDVNPILSANRDQFKLREMDGSITTFDRIGEIP